MITPPSTTYSGLTLILDTPSRLNKDSIIYGGAKAWLEEDCLVAGHTLASIEMRTLSCSSPFRDGTKYLALMGPECAARYGGNINRHGYPVRIGTGQVQALVTYDPQDCNDFQNMREADADEDDDESQASQKDTGKTRRKNWRFWTSWHLRKLVSSSTPRYPKLEPILYPNLDEAIKVLSSIRNEYLYLDIETSRHFGHLLCIGFSSESLFPRVYVVPVYDATGTLAYSEWHRLYRAISIALGTNTVVAHNGAGFDFFVLRAYYKFPWPRDVYDTMIANHRCFPEVEKSLAHLIAQWTWLPYHKDEIIDPRDGQQYTRLMNYNAKDVYALKFLRDAQMAYAANDPGLLASIKQANESVVPYNDTSRIGLRIDQNKLAVASMKLEAQKKCYERIARILTANPTFNPGSSDQCREFFNNKLHYEVIATTDAGKSAIGSKQLYQLHLKHNNPLIPIILKYREVAKDNSMLETELWEEL